MRSLFIYFIRCWKNRSVNTIFIVLEGRPSPSKFYGSSHRQANKLLSKVYECIVRENKGKIPYLSFDW